MIRLILVFVATALSISACDQMPKPASNTETAAADTSLATEEDKTFYALGLAVAESLSQFDMTEAELKVFQTGLTDALSGKKTAVDAAEYRNKISELGRTRLQASAQKAKVASADYLAKMAAEPGAQTFDSGLVMLELVPGDGPQPAATDSVTVHYHGTLPDGTVFDSSVDRGTPATFPLNGVISCWTEGVQKIKVGGKSRLICPSDIAYGDRGRPPKIPPGATLVFDVELLSIE